jgi:hypothetical protein
MKELWAAIYAALTGDALLVALTHHAAGDPHISRARQGQRISPPCVLFDTAGVEPGSDGAEYQRHRIAAHVYAADETVAADIAQRVMLALHGKSPTAAHVRVALCAHEASGALAWDDPNQCYAQDIWFMAGAINT